MKRSVTVAVGTIAAAAFVTATATGASAAPAAAQQDAPAIANPAFAAAAQVETVGIEQGVTPQFLPAAVVLAPYALPLAAAAYQNAKFGSIFGFSSADTSVSGSNAEVIFDR